MEYVTTIAELQEAITVLPRPLGFVPTMGALHLGHVTLVRQACADNSSVAVSIFINPAQFGDVGGYEQYPRDLDADLRMLRQEGVNLVFVPKVEELYPVGFDTWIEPGRLAGLLEGEYRPGHFRGVSTIVTKLLSAFRPTRAYFGEKDAQQLLLIRKLVTDLNLGVQVIGVSTVREADGLAFSSRNSLLSPTERTAATILIQSLELARRELERSVIDAHVVLDQMRALLMTEPLAQIDYISMAHPDTLEELTTVDGPVLVSLAVWIGSTRLIDNIRHDPRE
jgi:pantoate--beta-alanine ligase